MASVDNSPKLENASTQPINNSVRAPGDYYASKTAGSAHGTEFNDESDKIKISTLIGIKVRHGLKVDALQSIYSLDGATFEGPFHGGTGGVLDYFVLFPGERIVGFQGRSGWQLDGIQFLTSSGRLSPYYGGGGGSWFDGSTYKINPGDTQGGLQWISGTVAESVISSFTGWWAKDVVPR